MKMKEIAKKDGNEVVVRDPFNTEQYHGAANISSLIASANRRVIERRSQYDALGEIGDAPIEAVRELRKAIEEDDEALKDFEGDLKSALLDMSGFKAFVVQIKGTGAKIDQLSVRGKFKAMLSKLKSREDSEKPDAPKHTYFYAVTATDAEHVALQRSIKKVDGLFSVVSPQKDSEWKNAAKLFGLKD